MPRPCRLRQRGTLASLQLAAERLEAECLLAIGELGTDQSREDDYQVVQAVVRAAHDSRIALGQMADRARASADSQDDGEHEYAAAGAMTEVPGSTEPRKPFAISFDRDWLLRMADREGACGCTSVGGLAVELGLYAQPNGSHADLGREINHLDFEC